jgi:tetratricopeptide (TPR) repeat protein
MLTSKTTSHLRKSLPKLRLLVSVLVTAGVMGTAPILVCRADAQEQPSQPEIIPSEPDTIEDFIETSTPRPNSLSNSVFSIAGGARLMSEAMAAVNQQNYPQAIAKLQDARQVYNQLSNFYLDLNNSFAGIDNRVSDSHRQKALETAQLRDQATYQLAIAYRANNQPELAIPLLVQLIRSQNPTRELGQQAYQQLFELGFVDVAYPRQSASDDTTPQG